MRGEQAGDMVNEAEDREPVSNRRIAIMGKTGAGKSSLANTIFGEKLFNIGRTASSETRQCKAETKSVSGRSITLIDTPGFFDTDRSEEELKSEVVRCITECAPGPHAFFIVLKVEKFTEHEQAVINKIHEYFSAEIFKYAALLFTHGDQLDEEQRIEDFVHQNKPLNDLVKKCGGRCHVIDNKYWKENPKDEYRSNQFQVEKVLKSIEKVVVENNGRCYTNEMLQVVEEEIQQEEEHIRQSLPNMSEKEIREQAVVNVSTKLSAKLAGIETAEESGAEKMLFSAARDSWMSEVLTTRRVVLLGKQGAGKSSLANTIFGEKLFDIGHTASSETRQCKAETKSVSGRSITLIDTPGLFDPGKTEEAMKTGMIRCITECAPGPHAFLIVLKAEKFTEKEQAVIKNILQYVSEAAFRYSAVVFTHGEQLPEGMKIEEFVSQNKLLSDLVKKCSGRCLVVDNEHWDDYDLIYSNKRVQVAELLNTIDEIVMENKGGYYTNETLQAVKTQIHKELDSQPAGQIPKEETSNKTNNVVSKNVWIKLTGPAAESMAKAFFGPADVVVQGNKEVTRGAEEGTAEEDSTARVETVSGPPSRIVIAGAVGAGKSIRVLKTQRIILLGKTGAGKSSLVNTIFGQDVFKINSSPICGTSNCQAVSKSVDGRRITLIDTPGFFDFSFSEEELKHEILRCMTECAPGPHAFFIVLKVEEFNKEERDVITKIFQYFSEEALKYTAVVFTHGDQLPEGMKIEEFVAQNKGLSDLVKKCGGRCHVVDNKYWKNSQHGEYRSNRFQVAELLNTTDKIVIENKGCYTNEMLQAVVREIEEEANRTSGGHMTQGDTSSKANNSVSKNVWIKLTGPAAKPLAEAFFGPAVVVLQEGATKETIEGTGPGEAEEEEEREDEEEIKEDDEDVAAETEEDAAEEETATEAEEEAAREEEEEENAEEMKEHCEEVAAETEEDAPQEETATEAEEEAATEEKDEEEREVEEEKDAAIETEEETDREAEGAKPTGTEKEGEAEKQREPETAAEKGETEREVATGKQKDTQAKRKQGGGGGGFGTFLGGLVGAAAGAAGAAAGAFAAAAGATAGAFAAAAGVGAGAAGAGAGAGAAGAGAGAGTAGAGAGTGAAGAGAGTGAAGAGAGTGAAGTGAGTGAAGAAGAGAGTGAAGVAAGAGAAGAGALTLGAAGAGALTLGAPAIDKQVKQVEKQAEQDKREGTQSQHPRDLSDF
ncbi:uncharacterized protein ABDE67_020534 [Symphorus nematophorus]